MLDASFIFCYNYNENLIINQVKFAQFYKPQIIFSILGYFMEKANKNKVERYNDPFPTRLRELMNNSGNPVTRQKLAEVLGITPQQVSNYTVGASLPDFNCIYKLAKYFNVSADYLLGIHDSPCSDINDQKISEELGLSERTIKRLREENADILDTWNKIRTEKATTWQSALEKFREENHHFGKTTDFEVINKLMDNAPEGNISILELLKDIFDFKYSKHIYCLSKLYLKEDGDEDLEETYKYAPIDYIDSTERLNLLILHLQQSIVDFAKQHCGMADDDDEDY